MYQGTNHIWSIAATTLVPIYSGRFHEFSMTSMLRDTGLNVHCQARVALPPGLFTYGASAEYIEVYLTIAGNWCTSDQARSRAATDRSICNEQTLRRSHTVGDMIYLIPRFFVSKVFVSNLSDGLAVGNGIPRSGSRSRIKTAVNRTIPTSGYYCPRWSDRVTPLLT